MVEKSGANQRRSNPPGQSPRANRSNRANQSNRSHNSARRSQANQTEKPSRTSDARYSGNTDRTEKSRTSRNKRLNPAGEKKRSFDGKPRSNERRSSQVTSPARKSTTQPKRERDYVKSEANSRVTKLGISRETGYQVRSAAARDRSITVDRNDKRRKPPQRVSYQSGDSKSTGDEKSGFKPRPARTDRTNLERRSNVGSGPRSARGGKGRAEREDRNQKFDIPRRFRGDLPRRERDQRARGNAPVIDQDITGDELGEELIAELKTLPTGLTISVAQHLVMTQRYLELDPKLALVHAVHAKELAGRFPIVREIVGIAHYVNGNWQEALNDFRAVKRMAAAEHLVPMMADCERGLGRPERAISMLTENRHLPGVVGIEAAIVEAGARSDLGQHDAALVALKIPALTGYPSDQTAYARLCFAYGATLAKLDRPEEAVTWFARADKADPGATAAADFLPNAAETIYLDDLDADS